MPESREELVGELSDCQLLRQINDSLYIYLIDGVKSKTIMREIGRLREVAFQKVGEGTGELRDVDQYDDYYQQIILWNKDEKAIIGGYRVADAG